MDHQTPAPHRSNGNGYGHFSDEELREDVRSGFVSVEKRLTEVEYLLARLSQNQIDLARQQGKTTKWAAVGVAVVSVAGSILSGYLKTKGYLP